MPRRTPHLTVSAVCLLLAASLPTAGIGAEAPLRVMVSIPPLAWFVQQVAGDLAEVTVLLGPGSSPHTYEPTPRQMVQLADAELFLTGGVPFERGLRPRIAAMGAGPRLAGPLPDPVADDGHGHDHADGLDPHRWLAPAGAAAIGDTVATVLLRLRPDQAARITAGRAALQERIDAVDLEVRRRLTDRRGATFIVYHPAFGHFAAAYSLEQVAIEDQGHEPGARHLAEVTDLARDRGVGAVVVQPQFSRRAAEAVAASIGVPVVELDPLAPVWDLNMVIIASTLAEVAGRPAAAEVRP